MQRGAMAVALLLLLFAVAAQGSPQPPPAVVGNATRDFLVIRPFAGLCNRLQVIVSAMALAEDLGRGLIVQWQPDPKQCNVHFSDIFNASRHFLVNVMPAGSWTGTGYHRMSLAEAKEKLQPGVNYGVGAYDEFYLNETRDDMARRHRLLSTMFVPQPALAVRVAALVDQFTPFTIGLHVRRFRKTGCLNPDVTFRVIREALAAHPRANIFLATNDPLARTVLQRTFSNVTTIMVQPNAVGLPRSSNGVSSAVIDLFALAKTNLLLGTKSSSYSRIAAHLGGIPLIYAGSPLKRFCGRWESL